MLSKKIFILVIIFAFTGVFTIAGINLNNTSSEINKGEIRPLRIGYVESEEFPLYTSLISNMAKDFQKMGVLDSYNIDGSSKSANEIWNEMCDHCISNDYKFIKDMFYNMKDTNEKVYSSAVNNESVDLVLVMGTTAGKYFADKEMKNKFMVFAAADPIRSGILKSATEKNNKNAFAHLDPNKYMRQIQAGHRLLNFKKVGVVFENNEDAYAYSAIGDLIDQSKKLNFEVVIRNVSEAKNNKDYERYYRDLTNAYKELVGEKIDMLYMTTATIQNERICDILGKDIYKNNIPVLAQTDESQVEFGATIGITMYDSVEQAAFAVNQIKSYREGIPFEDLDQINESTAKIYLNYNIAKSLGISFPFSTLLIVDKIY